MEWIEISAKTLNLAVERALDTLGVHETELEYETLDEPSSKLFGLRKTDARIRARVKPISREKPNDKRRRKQREERRSRGSKDGSPKDGSEKSTGTDSIAADATSSAQRNGERNSSRAKKPKPAPVDKATKPAVEGVAASANESSDTAVAAVQSAPKPKPRQQREAEPMHTGTIEEQLSHASAFGEGLLDAFGIEANATATVVDDDVIELAITGQDLGLLVGPKAATLASLEELLRGSVGHRGPARLHLDVAGYRQKRREALTKFALSVAAEVANTGVAKALEPMSAQDRKVVHDAVTEIDGVETISDGEDQRRRVVIKPV